MNLNKIKKNILIEAKPYIIKYGWNEEMFRKVAKHSKHEFSLVLSVFPNGYINLIQLYLDNINTKMTDESKKMDLIRLKVHERIRELSILRFKIMEKEKELSRKTFIHLLLPTKYNFSIKNIYKSVDQIWYLAGDNSTDFNFYSKRVILASIYFVTLMHFINNNNFDETKRILNEQLKNVSKIPKIKERFNAFIKLSPQFFKLRKNFKFTKQ